MKSSLSAVLAGALLATIPSFATDYYWIGDLSSEYTDAGNWRVGSANGAVATTLPANDDYSDGVFFTDAAVSKTVHLSSGRSVGRIIFENATGYELTGSGLAKRKSVTASGTGDIAVIKGSSEFGGIPISVSGGTLTLDWSLYFTSSDTMTIAGEGGTFRITGSVGGWSKDRCFKITGNSTLRLDGSPAFSLACKHVSLAAAGAKFVYRDTVAGAEAKFGKSSSGANGIVNEYDPVNASLTARALDGDLAGYVEVSLLAPGTCTLTRDANEDFVVTAKNDFAAAAMNVIASDGVNADIVVPLGTGVVPAGTEVTASLGSHLAADTTYSLAFQSIQTAGTKTLPLGTVYTGTPALSVTADADEAAMTPGTLRISRAAASSYPLEVHYAFSSADAVAGTDFIAPSGHATIPAGASFVDITVMPLSNGAIKTDQTITFALAAGDYTLAGAVPTAMTILNSQEEMPENVWIAGEGSDNLASTAANWSRGVPTADSDILIQGNFSSNPVIWDLATSVKSFVQTNYTGTVTFRTVYGSSGFTVFTVLGDCMVHSGTWTHPANGSTATYRLNVAVGGDFTLGAAASINLNQKGYATGAVPEGCARGLHGGGRASLATTFGSVYAPESLGPGGDSTPGGGALKLAVTGDAIINGTIDVGAGKNSNSWGSANYGAPGSVFLTAASVSGTGAIDAAAPLYSASDGSTPSGGRVAIVLTAAATLGLPRANIATSGTLARGSTSSGGGTLLVKAPGQTHGTLYVDNVARENGGTYGIMPPGVYGTTLIPPGETWTLDGIVFSGAGILAVPEGTTLRLPNGFASISGSSYRAGLLYLGGTIDAGEESPHVLQGGKWVFDAETPYTFGRSVVVRNEAAIGTLRLLCSMADPRCGDVRVNGDLTVESTGFLYATGAGFVHPPSGTPRPAGVYAYGGMPAIYGSDVAKAYGSALNPLAPGMYGMFNDSAGQYTGGGALKVTVSGRLTLDGKAVSIGSADGAYNPGGTGGSLHLVAGSITGSGSVNVNGNGAEQNPSGIDSVAKLENRGAIACAGGGRVSIRLTDRAATFPEGFAGRVTAYGGVFKNGASTGTATNAMASAGTIYLQDATQAEGAGTVYVKNGARNNNVYGWTPFPAGVQGDKLDSLKGVSLDVSEAGRVAVFNGLKIAKLRLAAGSAVNLNGGTFTVETAQFGTAKLAQGVYTAADAAVAGFVEDSIGGGTLVVRGNAVVVLLR